MLLVNDWSLIITEHFKAVSSLRIPGRSLRVYALCSVIVKYKVIYAIE